MKLSCLAGTDNFGLSFSPHYQFPEYCYNIQFNLRFDLFDLIRLDFIQISFQFISGNEFKFNLWMKAWIKQIKQPQLNFVIKLLVS